MSIVADSPSSPEPDNRPQPAADDIRQLRLSQDYAKTGGTKRIVTHVAAAKPPRQAFIYVHPSIDWRFTAAMIELKDEREIYLVAPTMQDELTGEWSPRELIACATRQGNHMLWPLRLPNPDGRLDQWGDSALTIVREHAGKWIRVAANMELGSYEAFEAVAQFSAPEWPTGGIDWMVATAFKGRVIGTPDHPVVKRLRGEI